MKSFVRPHGGNLRVEGEVPQVFFRSLFDPESGDGGRFGPGLTRQVPHDDLSGGYRGRNPRGARHLGCPSADVRDQTIIFLMRPGAESRPGASQVLCGRDTARVAVRTWRVRASLRRKIAVIRRGLSRLDPRALSPFSPRCRRMVCTSGPAITVMNRRPSERVRVRWKMGRRPSSDVSDPEDGLHIGERGAGAPERVLVPLGHAGAQAADAGMWDHGAGEWWALPGDGPGLPAVVAGDDIDGVVSPDPAALLADPADPLPDIVRGRPVRR